MRHQRLLWTDVGAHNPCQLRKIHLAANAPRQRAFGIRQFQTDAIGPTGRVKHPVHHFDHRGVLATVFGHDLRLHAGVNLAERRRWQHHFNPQWINLGQLEDGFASVACLCQALRAEGR